MKDAVKFLARRDSCTSVLRKLGIHARDYDAFIEVLSDGRFACHTGRAELHFAELKAKTEPKAEPNVVFTSGDKDPIKGKPGQRFHAVEAKSTIASVTRAMILDGKPNAEIWEVISKKFNLNETKRSYPSWFRCECRRKGQITSED